MWCKTVLKAVTLDLGCTLLYNSGCWGEHPSDSVVKTWSKIVLFLEKQGYEVEINDIISALKQWRKVSGLSIGVDYEYWAKLMIYYVLRITGIRVRHDLVEEAYRIYVDSYKKTLRLHDDVYWFLDNIKKQHLLLGVITNSNSHDIVVGALERHGILDYFDVVVSSQLIGCRKPCRTIFLKTAEFLGVEPNTIIHVGDSLVSDFNGALNAGYKGAVLVARHRSCNRKPCSKDLRGVLDYIIKWIE